MRWSYLFLICNLSDKTLLNQNKSKTYSNITVANNVYNLPSIEAVVRYLYATAGFPVKQTWCQAIAKGNYTTWPALTLDIVQKYYLQAEETSMGTISQIRKNIRSTKDKQKINSTIHPSMNSQPKSIGCKQVFIYICHSSRMHADQAGKFPCVARSGNQYLMIAYVVDPNLILAKAFKRKTKEDLTVTYLSIKHELNKKGIQVSLHILDNEASHLYKEAIEKEQCTYQLVPPNNHRRNAAERAIRTFKDHFLRIIAGVAPTFPMSM